MYRIGRNDLGDLAALERMGDIGSVQSLRATIRIYVVALALLLSATLAFLAITTKDGLIARFFWGLWCSITAGVVLSAYRKESGIAQNPVPVSGTVIEVKLGNRGRRTVRYQFVASDGTRYEGIVRLGCRETYHPGF